MITMYTLALILLQFISLTNELSIYKNRDYITPENSILFNEKYIHDIYKQINDTVLSFEALTQALKGHCMLTCKNILNNNEILTIIDYSKSSNTERFFVIDINKKKILYKSLVAHGKNSGVKYASSFSNMPYSYKSSIGFFLTGETYNGKHGFSLQLNGLEKEINDKAKERGIVIHSASYVTSEFIQKYGRLGRSYGCPALPSGNYEKIINTIKNKTCLFIYYPDKNYLKESKIINPPDNTWIN